MITRVSLTNQQEILIVDPHTLFRQGLKWIFSEINSHFTLSEAANLSQAALLIQESSFTLIAFEWSGMDMPIDSWVAQMRKINPAVILVAVTWREAKRDMMHCLELGINGYICKSMTSEEIMNALIMVMNGTIFVPAHLAVPAKAANDHSKSDASQITNQPMGKSSHSLTQRQREVLVRLLTGRTTKEIARDLNLAEGTIKIHLAAIFRFMGARNRTEAAARASQMQFNGSLQLDLSRAS